MSRQADCAVIMETRLETLVAEDDPDDACLLERALNKGGVKAPVHFVHDGQEAVDYLSGEHLPGSATRASWPTLLLLDLKMPKLSGFEVLEWVRTQPALKDMVVVVFSSSGLEEDKLQAYALGADSYVEKPSYPDDLLHFAQRLESFWNKLKNPPGNRAKGPS